MKNRWIVVTGSSTGIGRTTVFALARAGFYVLAGVRKDADAASITEEASKAGVAERIEPILLDVTDESHIKSLASRLNQLGEGDELFGLVNNAGTAYAGPIEALSRDVWEKQFATNFIGPTMVTAALIPSLRKSKGRIVSVGSVAGRASLPFMAPYVSSKFAMEGWTDALRIELAPDGIQVSIVEPGAISTPIWDKGAGHGREVAESLSPALRQRYGPSMEAMEKASARSATGATSPDAVARVITRAMTAKKPRSRYLMGRDARLQVFLRAILPNRTVDAILVRVLGLPH
jgi:NAD(P)-dependent dehydrogenase (short-subunit alcohol dehydrogenase family)